MTVSHSHGQEWAFYIKWLNIGILEELGSVQNIYMKYIHKFYEIEYSYHNFTILILNMMISISNGSILGY